MKIQFFFLEAVHFRGQMVMGNGDHTTLARKHVWRKTYFR